MGRKTIIHIIEWSIAGAAYVYLVYRLATYDQYEVVAASLRSMDGWQWGALALCVALMPVNMLIEAWKWYSLMNDGVNELTNERLSFKEAQRQVYYSKLAGLITPWRLGEYPARGVILVESLEFRVARSRLVDSRQLMAKVIAMGAIGSATMTTVIIVCGVIAMITDLGFKIDDLRFSYYVGLAVLLVLLGLALYFAPQLLKRWATVSHRLVAISLGQSFVRLVCWCVQLGLVIVALSSCRYDVMTLLRLSLVYYLLVTVTPNVPIAEVGVRGAWAMMLFGTVNAALAGVVLWVINTLLPCLLWMFFRKNTK